MESIDTKRCRQSKPIGKETNRRRLFTLRRLRRSKSALLYPFLHKIEAEASKFRPKLW